MREPRVGDIRECQYTRKNYEITADAGDGQLLIQFEGEPAACPWRPQYLISDTLISHMPDPANPQVGDRFRTPDGLSDYTITSVPDANNRPHVCLRIHAGVHSGSDTKWPISWIKNDTPLRTIVPTAGPAASLVIVDDPPNIEPTVGYSMASAAWPEDKFVTVEWVGDTAFAGTVTSSDHLDGMKMTFDRKSPQSVWHIWQVPPVEVEPVVNEWLVKTVDRKGQWGDLIVDLDDNEETYSAKVHITSGHAVAVIESVEPYDPPKPPRIKTVWRVPKIGERYISMGDGTPDVLEATSHNGPRDEGDSQGLPPQRQVLVVE